MNKLIIVVIVLIGITLLLNSLTSKVGEKPEEDSAPMKVSESAPSTDKMFAAVHSGDYDTIDELLEKEPDLVNKIHSQGGTFMNCAVSAGNVQMVEYLLEHGAHPDGNAECGVTGLDLAVRNGDLKSAEVLIKSGATINKVTGSKSLLDEAEAAGNEAMVELLKKHGAKSAKELPKPETSKSNSTSMPVVPSEE